MNFNMQNKRLYRPYGWQRGYSMGMMRPYYGFQEALELVKQSVQGEKNDELFYDYLINVAPTEEEKEIIATIRDDEIKHNKMFRQIYKDFTGETISPKGEEDFEKPESYLDGIRRALFGELAAMERYRLIRAGLPGRYYRDMVFEILTDELKHGHKYNYILNLQHLSHMEKMEKMDMMRKNMNVNNKAHEERNKNKYTPDDWIRYIYPIVRRALKEAEAGVDLEHVFIEYILAGVLVGKGSTIKDAIERVEVWEETGQSNILKGK